MIEDVILTRLRMEAEIIKLKKTLKSDSYFDLVYCFDTLDDDRTGQITKNNFVEFFRLQ
jgi:Ca2+-binding EF-hand superfamily protein